MPDHARSAIAFLILTTTPGVFVLGGLGPLVWERGAAGPHEALLTLVAAGAAAGDSGIVGVQQRIARAGGGR